jgi:hypothetical protein
VGTNSERDLEFLWRLDMKRRVAAYAANLPGGVGSIKDKARSNNRGRLLDAGRGKHSSCVTGRGRGQS